MTRLLVVGDSMLDRDLVGAAERLSPEAPVHRIFALVKLDLVVPLRADIDAASSAIAGDAV